MALTLHPTPLDSILVQLGGGLIRTVESERAVSLSSSVSIKVSSDEGWVLFYLKGTFIIGSSLFNF